MRANIFQRIHRPSLVVHQGKFDGIEGQVLDFIGRTERDEFDVVLDLDFAKQAMRRAVGSGTEGKTKLSLAIHWDAT